MVAWDSLLTYVEYPTEDHCLRRYEATVRDRQERMAAFLARHLDTSGPEGELAKVETMRPGPPQARMSGPGGRPRMQG